MIFNFLNRFVFIVESLANISDQRNIIFTINNAVKSGAPSQIEKNMPWIAAIIVCILTICTNILINYQSRKTSRRILSEQLEHNKELAIEQIKSSQKNVQKEFDKTVLVGNRQVLITNIREIISSIITKASISYLKEQINTEDYEELKLLITKAELFLNPVDDNELLKNLNNLDRIYFEILSSNKDFSFLKPTIEEVKQNTLVKIQSEWNKASKGI